MHRRLRGGRSHRLPRLPAPGIALRTARPEAFGVAGLLQLVEHMTIFTDAGRVSRWLDAPGEAGALLADAFVDDPVMRYYFEGDPDRAQAVHRMMTLAVGLTARHGCSFRLDSDTGLTGIALLLPPALRDFPLPAVLGAVLRSPRLWRPRGLARYFGVETSVQAHRPAFACWTLLSLGVAPSKQHRGHGSRLLAEVLRQLPEGEAMCLETYNERNLPLYARFGFRITAEFVTHRGKGPRAWALLRPADAGVPGKDVSQPGR